MQVSYPWQLDSEHVGTCAPQPHRRLAGPWSESIVSLAHLLPIRSDFSFELLDFVNSYESQAALLQLRELLVSAMPPIHWPQRFQAIPPDTLLTFRGSIVSRHGGTSDFPKDTLRTSEFRADLRAPALPTPRAPHGRDPREIELGIHPPTNLMDQWIMDQLAVGSRLWIRIDPHDPLSWIMDPDSYSV